MNWIISPCKHQIITAFFHAHLHTVTNLPIKFMLKHQGIALTRYVDRKIDKLDVYSYSPIKFVISSRALGEIVLIRSENRLTSCLLYILISVGMGRSCL